jgi:hypothetical protein
MKPHSCIVSFFNKATVANAWVKKNTANKDVMCSINNTQQENMYFPA